MSGRRWVKATIWPIHEKAAIEKDPKHTEELRNTVIRVRVSDAHVHSHSKCNPKVWYEIHPDDARKIFPNYNPDFRAAMCEHEIRLVS